MSNLVFVRSAGACPRMGEVVIPGDYLLPFFSLIQQMITDHGIVTAG